MQNNTILNKIFNESHQGQLPLSVKKYLSKYTISQWSLESSNISGLKNTIIIPAIAEFENIKILLSSLSELENKYFKETLFIFVINNSASVSEDISRDNASTMQFLRAIINTKNSTENSLINKIISSGIQIALVDASSPGNELPEKDAGAGLARKIGMDLALTVFDYSLSSKNIIINLDADCTVEKNYLNEIVDNFNKNNLSAAVIKYTHSNSNDIEIEKAITCYEIFLYYYDLGLKYAGSHFAYHTIGSTMACDYESYIKTGGMNKRKAGEDFYFLQKLAKNFKVKKINSTIVHPAPRISLRVPYGTGQRIKRFVSGIQNEYLLYNPKSFYILKFWLNLFMKGNKLSTKKYLSEAKKIDNNLYEFLMQQNFEWNWDKIEKNSASKEQLQKQKYFWFDSFRTLKLIHYLRDNGFPMINMFDALDKLFNKINLSLSERNDNPVPDLDTQKKYLEIIRNYVNK